MPTFGRLSFRERCVDSEILYVSFVQIRNHCWYLQVVPIIDLMAVSNAHFSKLKDFITLQLPAGFPVKIGQCFAGLSNSCAD